MRDGDRFMLHRDKAVLVVVDIQERLMAAMDKREKLYRNSITMIEAAKVLGLPIVVTEQYPKGLGPTVSEIRGVLPSYSPIEKITFGCCGEERFMQEMKSVGRGQVILIGSETHVCVLQTCLGLLQEGYVVHTVRDAVCSRTKENFLTGLEIMREAGAVITSVEAALFQLLYKAGSEEFKTISRLVK